MLKLGMAIGLIICAVMATMAFQPSPTVCERTLQYRVGEIDPRFGISTRAFREAGRDAAHMWQEPTGHNLFAYNPTADFSINLVFDERQQATISGHHLTRKLDRTETSHDEVNKMYERWREIYQERTADFQRDLADYQARLGTHNATVMRWNQQGGAPQAKHNALEAEREQLDRLKADLEDQRDDIQDIVESLKSLEKQSKALVARYNRGAQAYNSLHGVQKPFHKGEYNGRNITIYQFHGQDDLTLVLAHELGHALGINHVADPKAIMNAMMGAQNVDNFELTPTDLNALSDICRRQ